MSSLLYILTGPSGCGKTTLLNSVTSDGICNIAPKYSQRKSRGLDDDIISIDNIEEVCDVIYEINGIKYGICINKLNEELEKGTDLIVILSDFRVVRKLKTAFGDRVKAVYISSAIDEKKLKDIHTKRYKFNPTDHQVNTLSTHIYKLTAASRTKDWNSAVNLMAELRDAWDSSLPESRSYEVRMNKIRLFHSRYIDNIYLFDHVILNYYKPDDMVKQMNNVIRHNSEHYRKKPKISPTVFMVTAASGAGKGTLMESLHIMGSDQIIITNKKAKRDVKPNDKRDGMEAIGYDGVFPDNYEWRWKFHGDVEYAISTDEIQRNIDTGKPQIFISNMGQIENARSRFGDRVVVIYLHATRSEESIREYQERNCSNKEDAERRIAEIYEVYSSYINNINNIDHVLLNTTYAEDLSEQMFKLIEYYNFK